jgi:BlaI family transcriptional regulator, penicillinase repressor
MDEMALGDRELDVMSLLWEHGSGTVSEMREWLPVDLAYTTVLTILRNLESKGFVRHETAGKAHRYFPRVAQRTAQRTMLAHLVDKLFHGSSEQLVAHLVEEREVSAEQLKRLSAQLQKMKKPGGKR